jgi:hypothetical protein
MPAIPINSECFLDLFTKVLSSFELKTIASVCLFAPYLHLSCSKDWDYRIHYYFQKYVGSFIMRQTTIFWLCNITYLTKMPDNQLKNDSDDN